jgi:hypothetical protein
MNICDHCLFNYACCLGDPVYITKVAEDGSMIKVVDDCNGFVEKKETANEELP